jgi:exodeoxyribonuclease VII large subunit
MGGRLSAAAVRLLGERHLRLEALARGLPPPRRIIETAAQRLDDRAERLEIALAARFDKARSSLTNIAQRLRSPAQQLVDHARRLDQTALRLPPAMLRQTERSAERLAALSQLLESLSPYRVLERGYVLVEDRAGHPLAAADIEPGQALNLRFHDAIVPARAEGLAAKKKTKPGTPEGQSSLF